MARKSIQRAARRQSPSSSQSARAPAPRKSVPVIRHQPGKGLVVSTRPPPDLEKAAGKIIEAKTIVQAVVAAHHSGNLDGKNYEMTWALDAAVELLEQASQQVSP